MGIGLSKILRGTTVENAVNSTTSAETLNFSEAFSLELVLRLVIIVLLTFIIAKIIKAIFRFEQQKYKEDITGKFIGNILICFPIPSVFFCFLPITRLYFGFIFEFSSPFWPGRMDFLPALRYNEKDHPHSGDKSGKAGASHAPAPQKKGRTSAEWKKSRIKRRIKSGYGL